MRFHIKILECDKLQTELMAIISQFYTLILYHWSLTNFFYRFLIALVSNIVTIFWSNRYLQRTAQSNMCIFSVTSRKVRMNIWETSETNRMFQHQLTVNILVQYEVSCRQFQPICFQLLLESVSIYPCTIYVYIGIHYWLWYFTKHTQTNIKLKVQK